MKRLLLIVAGCMTAMLVMSCSSHAAQNQDNSVPDSLKRTLQFLTDMDISPDTLMMPQQVNYPVFADTTSHAHWLTANEATTLGLQQLCGVDADNTPAQLMGVWSVSKDITLLMFQIYYGDHSPVVLATYDTDGVIMDMMNVGTWAGVNTAYTDEARIGVDSAMMRIGDLGRFELDRTLTMVEVATNDAMWAYESHSKYQIDPGVGTITLLGCENNKPQENNEHIAIRELEEITWAPLQDEQVMAQYDAFAGSYADKLRDGGLLRTRFDFALFDRLDHAPWSMLLWLYEHPESSAHKLFIAAVWEHQLDSKRLSHAVSTIHDAKAKKYWKTQLGLK